MSNQLYDQQLKKLKRQDLQDKILKKVNTMINQALLDRAMQDKSVNPKSRQRYVVSPKRKYDTSCAEERKKLAVDLLQIYENRLGLKRKAAFKKFEDSLEFMKGLNTFVQTNEIYSLLNPANVREVKQFLNLKKAGGECVSKNSLFRHMYEDLRGDQIKPGGPGPRGFRQFKYKLIDRSGIDTLLSRTGSQELKGNQEGYWEIEDICEKHLLAKAQKSPQSIFYQRDQRQGIVSQQQKALALLLNEPGYEKFVSMSIKSFTKIISRMLAEYYSRSQQDTGTVSAKSKQSQKRIPVQNDNLRDRYLSIMCRIASEEKQLQKVANQQLYSRIKMHKEYLSQLESIQNGLKEKQLSAAELCNLVEVGPAAKRQKLRLRRAR